MLVGVDSDDKTELRLVVVDETGRTVVLLLIELLLSVDVVTEVGVKLEAREIVDATLEDVVDDGSRELVEERTRLVVLDVLKELELETPEEL